MSKFRDVHALHVWALLQNCSCPGVVTSYKATSRQELDRNCELPSSPSGFRNHVMNMAPSRDSGTPTFSQAPARPSGGGYTLLAKPSAEHVVHTAAVEVQQLLMAGRRVEALK